MLKVRTAHHRQLAALNRKLDQLLAAVETSCTIPSATSQPRHGIRAPINHGTLDTRSSIIQLPTSTWNNHAKKLADDCMEYRLADGTPDKVKIARDAYLIAKFITAANIENVFNTLRQKSESTVPF